MRVRLLPSAAPLFSSSLQTPRRVLRRAQIENDSVTRQATDADVGPQQGVSVHQHALPAHGSSLPASGATQAHAGKELTTGSASQPAKEVCAVQFAPNP